MKRMHGKGAQAKMPAAGGNEEVAESHSQGEERPQSRKEYLFDKVKEMRK
jgi:hypothetical protein